MPEQVTHPLPHAKYGVATGIFKATNAISGDAIVEFDTENRPDILAKCAMCDHIFADHNIYCSKCSKWKHEFLVRVPGKWWSSATDIFLMRTRKFRRCDICKTEINCRSRFVQRCVQTRYGKTWQSKTLFLSRDWYVGTSSGHTLYYWGAEAHYCLNCTRIAFEGLRVYKCTGDNSWMADGHYYADTHPLKIDVETFLFNELLPKTAWTLPTQSLGV